MDAVTSIQPQLWISRAGAAVDFYARAFGAEVRHLVGEGDDIVAQLSVGDAWFWVSAADPAAGRLDPVSSGGATGRVLLVVADPDSVAARAVAAGAREVSAVSDEHGWRLGRVVDPFGHEWEIGRPLGEWPPG
jgi:PhnB protein